MNFCWIHYCTNRFHMWLWTSNSLLTGNKDLDWAGFTLTASSLSPVWRKWANGHSWYFTAAIITVKRLLSSGSRYRSCDCSERARRWTGPVCCPFPGPGSHLMEALLSLLAPLSSDCKPVDDGSDSATLLHLSLQQQKNNPGSCMLLSVHLFPCVTDKEVQGRTVKVKCDRRFFSVAAEVFSFHPVRRSQSFPHSLAIFKRSHFKPPDEWVGSALVSNVLQRTQKLKCCTHPDACLIQEHWVYGEVMNSYLPQLMTWYSKDMLTGDAGQWKWEESEE